MILYILRIEVKKGQDQKLKTSSSVKFCGFSPVSNIAFLRTNRKHHEITASINKKKLHNGYSAECAPCALLLSPERPVQLPFTLSDSRVCKIN